MCIKTKKILPEACTAGKTVDADMLVAYYSKGCDSHDLFDSLKIAQSDHYTEHLNQYNVIHINMQNFVSENDSIHEMIADLTESITDEIFDLDPSIQYKKRIISRILKTYYSIHHESFIFIIDEWDCIFREYKENIEEQKKYLDFLRDLLKDQPYVSLAYMTGILPIKKYGTHSALNMFDEVSMVSPKQMSQFMVFTEEEVIELCKERNIEFEPLKVWYDGYHVNGRDLYNPKSISEAVTNRRIESYWTQTETYEALRVYIDLNYEGLKDAIVEMLEGKTIRIDTIPFQNDMSTFSSMDDVLTLLVHLGYLAYNIDTKEVCIPNREIKESFYSSIKNSSYGPVTKAIKNSDNLLKATIAMNEERVAKYIEEAHLETSILSYNSEEALSYTLGLAYYIAKHDYTIIRELPTGKGFADLVFIPKKDKPAMIIELKWNQDVSTAITQIKNKEYYYGLENYQDNLLLVGISYDKDTKVHSCKIEKYQK